MYSGGIKTFHGSTSGSHLTLFLTTENSVLYDEYSWEVVGDFKIMGLLMGLRDGFYQIFLLSLSLRQQGHHGTLPQAGLGTAEITLTK